MQFKGTILKLKIEMLQLKLNTRLNKNFPKVLYTHWIDCTEYLQI